MGERGAGVGWVVAKAKTKKQGTTTVEFRVRGCDIHMDSQRVSIPLQGLDRHVLTVGTISGPHCQIGALHWHHFTNRGFIWSKESILDKQTS